MKIPRCSLLAVSAAFALSLACGPTPVRAETPPDDAKRREAAEELLKARKTEDLVNNQANHLMDGTDQVSANFAKQAGAAANQQELLQKMRTETHDLIRKEFNWEALKPEFVQAYSQAFTEAELKEMIAFYQTPTGKKLAALEPEISDKLSKLSQDKVRSIIPHVMQRMREMVAATKPPGTSTGPQVPGLPPGMTAPPPPPPGLVIPPPPPPGAVPSAPPTMTPPPALPGMPSPPAPPTMTPPPPPPASTSSTTPAVHPGGKTEPGTL